MEAVESVLDKSSQLNVQVFTCSTLYMFACLAWNPVKIDDNEPLEIRDYNLNDIEVLYRHFITAKPSVSITIPHSNLG